MTTYTNTNLRGRPLIAEEVPVDIRHAYDYSSQAIEFSQARGKRVMMIDRTCLSCGKRERVRVSLVREALRLGRLTGLCSTCFSRTSRPQPKGKESPGWKGGRRQTPRGYIMVRCPDHPSAQNGYVQEHRLVMEEYLSRLLLPSETVHHKNGIKSDNRIENLELWSKSHGDGQRYEDMSNDQIRNLIKYLEDLLEARKT